MRLESRRLVLRDLEPDDWRAMLRVEGDAETVRFQSYAPRTAEECRAYLARDLALWGQALMPEAAKAMLEVGFGRLGLHRVFLDCDPRNRGAIRLAEKLGMTREAHLRESFFAKGEWSDSLIYAILAREQRP